MKTASSRSFQLAVLLAALLADLGLASLAGAVQVEVKLVAPPGSEKEVKAVISESVVALPVAVNQPVAKGTILAEVDTAKLQKELEGLTKSLRNAQEQKRYLATQRGATSSSATTGGRAGQQNAQEVAAAQMAEANAISDLARVQTELATANVRAPDDGYVSRQLYAVGAKAKRRKPFLTFVEARSTVVEAAIPAAEAGPFGVGKEVRIADAANPSRSFRGKVLNATPAEDAVALRIQPLELPFLALSTSAAVTLSAAP
jgi:multidrug resistance efflux pump